MSAINKYRQDLAIVMIISLILHIIDPVKVLAHNPYHSGQNIGGGDTDSPPEDGDNGGEPDTKDEDDENQNKPEDSCEVKPKPSGNDGSEGDPIYLFDGKFFYYHTLSGKIPLKIGRSYDSYCLYNGPFGFGWSFTYNIRVYRLSDGNLLLRRGSNAKDIFISVGSNTYEGPVGNYDTIAINGDGTYTLTRKNGYKYQFDINGCLSAVEDRIGNSLRMSYDPAGKLPINGISPYSNITTPIVIGYDWQLTKVEEYCLEAPTGRYVELSYNDNGRIIRAADSTGREVLYTYDKSGNGDLVGMRDPEGNLYTYAYDRHLMTSYMGLGCADCGIHTNTYDSEKRVVRQTHGNHVVEIDYLTPKSKTKVTTSIYNDQTDELIHRRHEYYEFNSSGFVTKFTRQVGAELDETGTETDDIVTTYTYNPNNELTRIVDPRGGTTTYTYDDRGNIVTESKLAGGETTITTAYTYEPTYNRMTSKEISSTAETQTYRTEYTYDANGNLTDETTFADSSDPNTAMVTSYAYDEYGNILAITDPLGNVTANEYNIYGFLTRTYDPNDPNHQTLYTYDDRGNTASTTDARGNATTFEYDNLGRVTKVTNRLGVDSIYTYNGANLVRIEEGRTAAESGRITVLDYDSLNRKTAVKMMADDSSEVTLFSYTYDSQGQVLTTADGNGNTTANAYDVLGRLVAVIDPNGFATTYTYDKANNVIQTTDAEEHSTHYKYDHANRLTEVIDALGNRTSYTYNALGGILTVTDARDNATTHTYDDAGRLIEIVDPMGHTTQYAYDKNGNLTEKIVPNEFSDPTGADPIIYQYDAYNQLTQIDYPDSKMVTFSYNGVGNIITWNDGTFSGSTNYDKLSRPLQVTTNYPGFSKTVAYTYNRFGERATMTDGEGRVTTYDYDALGRVTHIVHPAGLTTKYTYDLGGRLIQKTLPNGVRTTYAHDISDRLTQLANTDPHGTTISLYTYSYDRVGNRLSMTTLEGTHNYGYDDIYQLVSATHPSQPAETFTYDPVGNRLSSADSSDWTYDNCNRLLAYDGVSFTYDENGNTTSKTDANGMVSYGYDYENRLCDLKASERAISYTYDPFGKRLSKVLDGNPEWYLYDKKDVIRSYDNSGNILRTFDHSIRIDEPIRLAVGHNIYYYSLDGLGSVIDLTDSGGAISESYQYGAFGDLLTSAPEQNPYTYTSREYDSESGLYYYRARFYVAKTGRFLQTDPIGFAAGPNFYTYVRNNPINYRDPSGLRECFDSTKYAECFDTAYRLYESCIKQAVKWVDRCESRVRECTRKCKEATKGWPTDPDSSAVVDCVETCIASLPFYCFATVPIYHGCNIAFASSALVCWADAWYEVPDHCPCK